MQNALSLIELKSISIALILLSIIFSCSDVQEREEPEKLLSKEQMVNIYTDMIFLDATQRSSPDDFKTYELKPSEHIYNKYKIDSTTLSENITYYNLDFETNTEIYEKVKQNITERSEAIDSISKLRDSLIQIEKKSKTVKLNDTTQSTIKKL
jgi:hypothetical protein